MGRLLFEEWHMVNSFFQASELLSGQKFTRANSTKRARNSVAHTSIPACRSATHSAHWRIAAYACRTNRRGGCLMALHSFEIHRVNLEDADGVETLGTKPKFWWFNSVGKRLLFKAEDRGTGEDWAEKIACHLCELLGIPHVDYELAQEYEQSQPRRNGVICENISPAPLSLVLGNQLLFERDDSYPRDERAKYKVRQHTVAAIVGVLKSVKPPIGWPANGAIQSALDVFIGYVMLDAWIANQDRHHGNWAAIRDVAGDLFLSPTFDHGAALARLLTDDERAERLSTRDRNRTVDNYVARARSACYADVSSEKPMGTLDCFTAFAAHSPVAARGWIDRLQTTDPKLVCEIVDRVPATRISDLAKQFTVKLLQANQQRILQGVSR